MLVAVIGTYLLWPVIDRLIGDTKEQLQECRQSVVKLEEDVAQYTGWYDKARTDFEQTQAALQKCEIELAATPDAIFESIYSGGTGASSVIAKQSFIDDAAAFKQKFPDARHYHAKLDALVDALKKDIANGPFDALRDRPLSESSVSLKISSDEVWQACYTDNYDGALPVVNVEITEKEDLPDGDVRRYGFRGVVRNGLKRASLIEVCERTARQLWKKHPSDAVSLFLYKKGGPTKGFYTACNAVLAPGGDWSKAHENIEKQIVVDVANSYFEH